MNFRCLLLVAALGAFGCSRPRVPANGEGFHVDAALATRGEYLVNIMICQDYHTPMKIGPGGPELDMERKLSGHPAELVMTPPPPLEGPWGWAGAITNTAFAGPWGISYAANLTPDELSGLGIWTEEMFIRAMRTGRHMGTSREIQPPMPWRFFAQATDEDLRAIYHYLRTLPPIRNHVPDYQEPEENPS